MTLIIVLHKQTSCPFQIEYRVQISESASIWSYEGEVTNIQSLICNVNDEILLSCKGHPDMEASDSQEDLLIYSESSISDEFN